MATLTRTDSLEEATQPPSNSNIDAPKDVPDSQDEESVPVQVTDDDFFSMVLDMDHKPPKEVDDMDYNFLTDFAIANIVFTVYEQLQANTFFKTEEKPQDPEEIALQEYQTKGKFRLCQLFPVVLRATIGYYANIGKPYYESTIQTRRLNQVPIGLNDKAYGVVCLAIKRFVVARRDRDDIVVKGEKLPIVEEGEETLDAQD